MATLLSFAPAELPADAIEVGRITDAWGVKGWFKVLSHSSNPQALFAAKTWYLQPSERGAKAFVGTVLLPIRQAKTHSDTVVAWAQGIDDRDAAEALRGARVFVPRAHFLFWNPPAMATTPLTLEPAELPPDAVEVGRIADAWGVKGWFKVLSHSSSPEALFASKRWYLQPSERGAKAFAGTVLLSIRQAKDHSDTVVAWAQGIDDRNAAEALRGARIFVPRSSFPSTSEDEFYWVDLIGLSVVNREGVALGQVQELMSTGPQTVLVLAYEQEGKTLERMIPFVSAFVDQVDLPEKRITVDWQPDY